MSLLSYKLAGVSCFFIKLSHNPPTYETLPVEASVQQKANKQPATGWCNFIPLHVFFSYIQWLLRLVQQLKTLNFNESKSNEDVVSSFTQFRSLSFFFLQKLELLLFMYK